MMSPGTLRIQFRLFTVFYVTTAVAILCVLWRQWYVSLPSAILSPALFVAAWWVARRGASPDLAWGLFAIGWLVAAIVCVNDLYDTTFYICPTQPNMILTWDEYGSSFVFGYLCNFTLPLYLSLPTVYLASKSSRGFRSSGRRWIILSAIVAFVDVTLLTILLVTFFWLHDKSFH